MKQALFIVLAALVSGSAFATPGTNCRLIVQIHYKDGKKKVIVEETGALSHLECKYAAQQRELDSDGADIQKVKVVFGYRELSVISDAEADSQ